MAGQQLVFPLSQLHAIRVTCKRCQLAMDVPKELLSAVLGGGKSCPGCKTAWGQEFDAGGRNAKGEPVKDNAFSLLWQFLTYLDKETSTDIAFGMVGQDEGYRHDGKSPIPNPSPN